MAQVEVSVDSIRVSTFPPGRTIILKQDGAERYLPFRVSGTQADILSREIQGRPDKSIEPDLFLASINALSSDLKCIIIHVDDEAFYAQLQFSHQGENHQVKCPIGVALALGFKARAPMLVDEVVLDKAGILLSP